MPYMKDDGVIIYISSRFGSIRKIFSGEFDDITCSYAYRISKAAQNMLTQCISREYRDSGVKVCAFHPGKLKTASASSDADKEPEEAARKLIRLIDKIENGKYYSLFEGESDW